MNELLLHRVRARLTLALTVWQAVAIGLLTLSAVANAALVLALMGARDQIVSAEAAYRVQIEQAEQTRECALEKLGVLSLQAERERQARAEQTAAFEAVGTLAYIGECTITAYCPCEACCGRWANGLTASGLPAGLGIVAVDPEIIPLGSTVVIDGQRYLAADTGVTGYCVDVCLPEHQDTVVFGVQKAKVWIETEGKKHG